MRKLDEKEYEIVWKKIDEKFGFEPSEALRNHIFNIDKEYKVYEINDGNCGDETYQSRINEILKKVVNDDMYALDWQHESFIYNPNENITLEQSGWLGNSGIYDGFPCYYPNGDYFFFVSLDFTKALLGVPGFGEEKSLLFVVGEQLIEEIDKNKVELLMTEYVAQTYICPVCGYDKLTMIPSNSYEICPCCGYEFGSMDFNGEDVGYSYDYVEDEKFFSYIRKLWIDSGCKWWREEEKTNNWNVEDQLKNIKSQKKIVRRKK